VEKIVNKFNTIEFSGGTEKVFDQLVHLVNEGSLAACFHELDGRKAVGIDGIDKAHYHALFGLQ
jgi:hypothetical protein